jgi:nucleoside-diphosphate-sugar epimerase
MSWKIKRVLLTGGGGLVGRALVPLLGRYEITHFDLADPGDGHRFIQGNLCDAAAVADACAGMDAVIHVAALHGRTWTDAGDAKAFCVNVLGTQWILEGASRAGVKRVVYTSSIWAAGHDQGTPSLPLDEATSREPNERYGLTKALNERQCRFAAANAELSVIVLRPGGIVPADRYQPDNISYLGCCVDVRDVAQAHVLALGAPESLRHDVFIVTADSALCGIAPQEYLRDPRACLLQLFPALAGREDILSGSLPKEWYSIAKARRALGYAPRFNFNPSIPENRSRTHEKDGSTHESGRQKSDNHRSEPGHRRSHR